MNGAMVKFAAALAGAVLVSGCAGTRDHRGAVIDQEMVSAVQVGVDNKASVEKTLGRPTFASQFTPNDWYYVSRDTNTVAFRSPQVARPDRAPRQLRPGRQRRRGAQDRQGAGRLDQPGQRPHPDAGPQARASSKRFSATSAPSAPAGGLPDPAQQ